jgi:S1-C subfamily serine protease
MPPRFLVIALLFGASGIVSGQSPAQMPGAAKDLVVQIVVRSDSGEFIHSGAGIVIGASDRITIATAAHVVAADNPGRTITVVFHFAPRDSSRATVQHADGDMDLAVIAVPRPAHAPRFSFDRAGDPRAMASGDPVIPVGCPHGVCWEPASVPDRFIRIYERGLVFESFVTDPGSSGGALFNRYWEIVGLVTAKGDPQGRALSIEEVMRKAREWQSTVDLHRRRMPRSGYSARALVLGLAASEGALRSEGRWPGGRASIVLRGQRTIGWHVAALRLAPPDQAVTAGLFGLDLQIRTDRLMLAPFVEFGFGRVEGRYDAGGYLVQSANGPVLQPFWQEAASDVIGFGGGALLGFAVVPHVSIEVLAGHWSFRQPSRLTAFPDLYLGAGLGFGF